jgi:hypothetical protein
MLSRYGHSPTVPLHHGISWSFSGGLLSIYYQKLGGKSSHSATLQSDVRNRCGTDRKGCTEREFDIHLHELKTEGEQVSLDFHSRVRNPARDELSDDLREVLLGG